MPLSTEVGLGPGDIVLDGDQKRGHSTLHFCPFLLWPNGWMVQDAVWYRTVVDLGQCHTVLDGDSFPQKGGTAAPTFRFTSVVANRPLGTEVGLGPGDIVLDGDPADPAERAHSPPFFGPCLLWPNG